MTITSVVGGFAWWLVLPDGTQFNGRAATMPQAWFEIWAIKLAHVKDDKQ
jgi:hypothetical protein